MPTDEIIETMARDDIVMLLARIADTAEIAGSVIDDDRLIKILTSKSFGYNEAFMFPKTFQSLCIRVRAMIAAAGRVE